MRRAVIALVLSSGCVTTAAIVKGDQVSFPLLVGATAGDVVVTGVIAAEAEGLTTAASIGTALAVTAVDVVVGCLFGACHSLKL